MSHWRRSPNTSDWRAISYVVDGLMRMRLGCVGYGANPVANPFLFGAVLAALAVHVAALYLAPTQYILRVEPIEPAAWLRIVAVATTILVAIEAHKFLRRQPPPEPAHGQDQPPAARPGQASDARVMMVLHAIRLTVARGATAEAWDHLPA